MNNEKIKDYVVSGFAIVYGLITIAIVIACIFKGIETGDRVYGVLVFATTVIGMALIEATGKAFELILQNDNID